jgi:hypothetical protein
MNEDEDIEAYFLQVDEVVNNIKGLEEEIKEWVVLKKVPISLPMRFDSNISSLEEREDLATLTMDSLHGRFTTYEMRIEKDNLVIKEETFKASKKTNQKAKSDSGRSDTSKDDEEVDNIFRRMKKGTEKCKGKIPLICFNCDVIGHFSNKFPHKKKKRNEEDNSKRKQIQKGKTTKKKIFKKSICTKKDSSSTNEYHFNDSDT